VNRSTWRWLLAALLTIAALTVVACGDDDEEEPAGTQGTATTETSGGEAEKFPADTTLGKI
jgi:hypothetical protein